MNKKDYNEQKINNENMNLISIIHKMKEIINKQWKKNKMNIKFQQNYKKIKVKNVVGKKTTKEVQKNSSE